MAFGFTFNFYEIKDPKKYMPKSNAVRYRE